MSITSIMPNYHTLKSVNIRTKSPCFTAIPNPNGYDICYDGKQNYNGSAPDKKIITTIEQFFPNPQNITIADIGAGDGRNSIPLAQKGYKIYSYELSPAGRKTLLQKAFKEELSGKIKAFNEDILKKPFYLNNNAVIMPHVSQNFSIDELETVFKNINTSIKQGGIFIFDALINNGKKRSASEYDIKTGCAFFNNDELIKVAKSKGFNLVEISDYKETGASRPFYIDIKSWNDNVDLKWFVFRKI